MVQSHDVAQSADATRPVDAESRTKTATEAIQSPSVRNGTTDAEREDSRARLHGVESLERQVVALEAQLRRERLERELEKRHHEALVTSLRERLEVVEADATWSTDTVPTPNPASYAACPNPHPNDLQAAMAQAERLAAELRAAYQQIAHLDHELSRAEHAQTTADSPPTPGARSLADELTVARKQIQELLSEREQLQQINRSLTDHLVRFGIQPKAL